jgi:nitrate reductase NapE component
MLSAHSQIKSKGGASLMGAAMVLHICVYKVLSQVAILYMGLCKWMIQVTLDLEVKFKLH